MEQQNRRDVAEQLRAAIERAARGVQLSPRHPRQREIDVRLREPGVGLEHMLVLDDRLVKPAGEMENPSDAALDDQ